MSKTFKRTQCPKCLDSGKDNLNHTSWGSKCFSCGFTRKNNTPTEVTKMPSKMITNGEFKELKHRGISQDVCEFFNYQVAKYKGSLVHVANYQLRS